MIKKSCVGLAIAVAMLVSAMPQASLGGTTGAVRGRVTDSVTHAPVADATVTAVAATQTATTVTNGGGNFSFISLGPDTYTISVQKNGYDSASQSGISVYADQSTNVSVSLHPALKTIAQVQSRSASSLVHSGTTSDVYSVNAAGQRAATALGGSGALNQAYSAIASAPGVSMPSGQQAWYQSVYIRGGDYDQVAYEFDGVPVIRESDGAPITTLAALGQQEVQVYTGGTPATSDSPGLAGYINQVIKSGTYPGSGSAEVAVGGPTFYHFLKAEAGGASPNRLFSYYVGTAGMNQTYRYGSQFNGAGDPLYFFPLYVPTNNAVYHILDGSGGTAANNWGSYFVPGSVNGQGYNEDRETVANVHFGIPHHFDSGRDDIQLLYVVGNLFTGFYSSANDIGAAEVTPCTPSPALPYCNPSTLANFWPGYPIPWLDSTYYTGQLGQAPNSNDVVAGVFPSSPTQRVYNYASPSGFNGTSNIDPSERDTSSNAFAIEKIQYQRNFNSSSFLRFGAYGEYTNWFIFGPNAAQLTFGAALPDYEVLGHIFGGNLTYANQLSSQHQLTAKLSYMTQKLQTYNAQFGATGLGTILSSYVDNSGNCYNFTTGALWSCYDGGSQGGLQSDGSINLTPSGNIPANSPAALAGAHWIMTENGYAAQVDNVTPYFSSAAITDVYHPNEKLTVNFGARFDSFSYRLNDLKSGYPTRQFWFNAFNRENCGAPGFAPVSIWNPNTLTFGTCPAGFTPMWNGTGPTPGVGLTNVGASTTTANVFQPRVAFTWALGPDTVIRGSYGKYARPAATSYQQYNTWQQDLASFISQFYAFGYTTPVHDVRPDTADNADISWEQRLKGTALSFKLTPFYRRTQNQLQYLAINPLQGTLAGLNIGTQVNAGVEFSAQYGDFSRDGLSGILSYTYTNSKVKYAPVSNGASVIDTLNNYIAQYNSYTKSCNPSVNPAAAQPGTSAYAACGTAVWGGQNAAPSLVNASASPITNPYYNQSAQPLLSRDAWYAPYDVTPAPFTAANGFETPDVVTMILNYRKGRFAITPSLIYSSGSVYGSPLVYPGYVPQSCTADPASTPLTPGVSCSGTYTTGTGAVESPGAVFLPDPYTRKFDAPGSLQEPSQLTLNLQMAYDISPRLTLTLIANNVYNKCYQRGTAWDDPNTCIYSNLPSNVLAPSGNFLAPSVTPVQVRYPYGTWFNNTQLGYTSELQPFQVTVDLNIKL